MSPDHSIRVIKKQTNKKSGVYTLSATLPTNIYPPLQIRILEVDSIHSQHYLSAIENQTQIAVQRIQYSWLTNSVAARLDDRKCSSLSPHQVTKYRFDSASLCAGFKGIACLAALVIDLEEVAVFFGI